MDASRGGRAGIMNSFVETQFEGLYILYFAHRFDGLSTLYGLGGESFYKTFTVCICIDRFGLITLVTSQ